MEKQRGMKEISFKQIKEIAEDIVSKANESENDFDAVDDVSTLLQKTFKKMNIAVESMSACKCTECVCNKKK